MQTLQTSKIDGVSADKARALHALGSCAYEIASAVGACAADANNGELQGRVAFSRTDITRGPEAAVIARCTDIHAAATEYLDELADYGVTNSKLTALKKRIDEFQAVQPKPRRRKATASSATKELGKVFRQVDALLTDKLDKLMVQFKESAPEFYNEYNSARKIVRHVGGGLGRTDSASVPVESSAATTLPKAA